MGLRVKRNTASASPNDIASGDPTVICVTVVADDATRALARYQITSPGFTFGHGETEINSDLVFVGIAGTPICTRVTIVGGPVGQQIEVLIFVTERDIAGNRVDNIEQSTGVNIHIG